MDHLVRTYINEGNFGVENGSVHVLRGELSSLLSTIHGGARIRLKVSFMLNHAREDYFSPEIASRWVTYNSLVELESVLDSLMAHINESETATIGEDSSVSVGNIGSVSVEVIRGNAGAGTWFSLSNQWIASKSTINPQNKDQRCFAYAVAIALNPQVAQNRERVSRYVLNDQPPARNEETGILSVNISGLTFPVNPFDHNAAIAAFEVANNISLSIWQINADDHSEMPKRIHAGRVDGNATVIDICYATRVVNILDAVVESHYVAVSDFRRMLRSKLTGGHAAETCFCRACFKPFSTFARMHEHYTLCADREITFTPTRHYFPGKFLSKNTARMCENVPVVYYYDFETFTCPDSGEMLPISYSIIGVCVDNPTLNFEQRTYRSTFSPRDTMIHFFSDLLLANQHYQSVIKTCQLPIDPTTVPAFDPDATCWICTAPFTEENTPVADHFHLKPSPNNPLLGAFRGWACSSCNTSCRIRKSGGKNEPDVPVTFWAHSAARFDTIIVHTWAREEIMRDAVVMTFPQLSLEQREKKVLYYTNPASAIPKGSTGFVRGGLGNLLFSDTLAHLGTSLDKAIKLLRGEMPLTKAWAQHNGIPFELVYAKLAFPYRVCDSVERFQNQTTLPPIEDFFSDLANKPCDPAAYANVERFWNGHCRTLGELNDLYNSLDTVQLADVFERFRRDMRVATNGLDAAHSMTAPSLSLAAWHHRAPCRIEMLPDPETESFYLKALRGGVSCVFEKFVQANIPEAPWYNPEMPRREIQYVDANSLYGSVMSEYKLPVGDFQIDPQPELWTHERILALEDNGDRHYIFRVNTHLPHAVQDAWSDYPLFVTHAVAIPEQMPERQLKLGAPTKTKKLMMDFADQTDYHVCHRLLKRWIQRGMRVTVTAVCSARQENCFGKFARGNMERRVQAQRDNNDMLAAGAKLMSNSLFGRVCMNPESLDSHRAFSGTEEKLVRRALMQPSFRDIIPCGSSYIVARTPESVKQEYAQHVGCSILSASKAAMHDAFWAHKDFYGHERARLLYTDTDSLVWSIETSDFESDIMSGPLAAWYDRSSFPREHRAFCDDNKGKAFLLKVETAGDKILEFVAMRAKTYSFQLLSDKKKAANKGCPRSHDTLKHEHYRAALFGEKLQPITGINAIVRRGCRLHYVAGSTRMNINPSDDKRVLNKEGWGTLPYNHYRITQPE